MTAAVQHEQPGRPGGVVRGVSPMFFGDAARRLFGVYHAPERAARDAGVVLCYPGPQEYRHTHWAFGKLAAMLAKDGFPTLRFDYFGVGDSFGDTEAASLAQWTADIALAANELRDQAGVRRISLVGMRLGAALAAGACEAGLRVKDLVLWEPVISGARYLAELEAADERVRHAFAYPVSEAADADALLGDPMPPAMRSALAELDLRNSGYGAPERIVMLTTRAGPDHAAVCARAEQVGVHCTVREVEDPVLYGPHGDDFGDTLLAHNIPNAIVATLAGRTA
jgi:pimeloyl-ACP methyl ester carboxylesterase